MGVEYEFVDEDTKKNVLMSMIPNPSHLESSAPVLLGTARARSIARMDGKGIQHGHHRVLPINIHGDAALAGQGVVYETLQMGDLPAYSVSYGVVYSLYTRYVHSMTTLLPQVGGTVHVVINNQIGFTTNPASGCSGNYCTDIAKSVQAPIFHVNADDPEAVTYVMEVAAKYRQKFHSDIFVDLVGYRRFGHNELDMPKFTNPIMYNLIGPHPNVMEIYSQKLISEGVITAEQFETMRKTVLQEYEDKYKKAKSYKPAASIRPFSPQWHDMAPPDRVCAPRLTGVPLDILKQIGEEVSTLPSSMEVHPTVAKVYKARLDAIRHEKDIDFALGEALAFGTLLRDGMRIRLTGQDCERGTFSHRHAVIHDQKSGDTYTPLKELCQKRRYKEGFTVANSLLSELAALGFEYGFSLENPNWLNVWEAQFGDFANGAQIVIDQFLVSGEVKWNQQSGLVLLLPHGYDGQGPEHSSGR